MYPNLRAEIARKGLSYDSAISEVLGIKNDSVYRREKNKKGFTLKEAIQIRDSLFPGQDIGYLFSVDING